MFSFLKSLLAVIGMVVMITVGLGIAAGVGYEWIAALLMIVLAAIYLTRKSKE